MRIAALELAALQAEQVDVEQGNQTYTLLELWESYKRTLAKVFYDIVKNLLFYLIDYEILASSSTFFNRI